MENHALTMARVTKVFVFVQIHTQDQTVKTLKVKLILILLS